MSKMIVEAFPDSLDPRFSEMRDGVFEDEPDRRGEIFRMKEGNLDTERVSALTPMGQFPELDGVLEYDAPVQGYDTTMSGVEFAKGTQIERRLVRLAQFDVIEDRFKLLVRSGRQTQQKHACYYNGVFSATDPLGFFTRSEGVAICSAAHTTNRSGVSTASGFSNLSTAGLSPTALKAAWLLKQLIKDDAGEPASPDGRTNTLWVHPNNWFRATEIMGTALGLDAANRNKNTLQDEWQVKKWIRLTSQVDWFLTDDDMQKDNCIWYTYDDLEFGRVEDFDSFTAKYRGYGFWGYLVSDWRHIIGANVG